MKIQYSRFRIFLFTFTFGLAVFSISARLSGYLDEIPVDLPKVESDTPIIIRICPELPSKNSKIIYQEDGSIYFSNEKAIDCARGGGAG